VRDHLRTASILAAVALGGDARAEPVTLTERPASTTEALATIDAPPREVYRVVTDYARWPALLTDVTTVTVQRGGRDDARVMFRSKAFEHEVAVEFDNVPNRALRFHSYDGPPGAHARGEYSLVPIDGGRRTRVVATLTLHVGGPARLLISQSRVRDMRRAKLERDLADVAAYFAARATASVR